MKHTNRVPVIVVSTVIVFAGMWGRNARASEPTENRTKSGTTVRVVVHHDGHIRVDNDRISEALRYAMKRSPSFGDLIATLEFLDRIVYIEEGQCRHRSQRACLQLMPGPGARNLLVRIDPRQPIRSVVAQLAHELYHAVEVAREPDVIDVASLRSLYERIGERSCVTESDDCWETRAAVAFEALVWREMAATHSAPPTHSH